MPHSSPLKFSRITRVVSAILMQKVVDISSSIFSDSLLSAQQLFEVAFQQLAPPFEPIGWTKITKMEL